MVHYGQLKKPLTTLLNKNSFQWGEEAQKAFEALKETMISAPTLTLPNFAKSFVVKIDASGNRIGATLM